MPGLIGKKIGMTSLYDDEGNNVPCTIIEASPNVVTQVRYQDKDGYEAVQLAYGEKKEKNTPAPLKGHFKKAGTTPKKSIKEFNGFEEELQPQNEVKVDLFEEGEFVDITGSSKGKGFQGGVKRWDFRGVGDMTHGQQDTQRMPGSIGGASDPSRVWKGLKMAGRTGGRRVTKKNLKVVKVLPEDGILVVKGAVPGHKEGFVWVTK